MKSHEGIRPLHAAPDDHGRDETPKATDAGSKESLALHYDKRASDYDARARTINERPEVQADLGEMTRVLDATFADRTVLEIAAGTGIWTEKIAGSARSVTATDLSAVMLSIAKTKQYPKNNVTFRAADMYTLDDLAAHEAAFAGFIFAHILKQDRAVFIDTINKHVVAGGEVVLVDNTQKLNRLPSTRTDDHGNTYEERALEDGSMEEIPKNYPTES